MGKRIAFTGGSGKVGRTVFEGRRRLSKRLKMSRKVKTVWGSAEGWPGEPASDP